MSTVLAAASPAPRHRQADPRHGRRRRRRRAQPVGALGRRRTRHAGRRLAAHRARGGRRRSKRSDADVVVLDIEMPELDGISALPLLLQKKRDLVVIMVSTLTRRSAEISLRALALGAADYIPKPEIDARSHDLGAVPPRTDRENPHSRPRPPLLPRVQRARRSPGRMRRLQVKRIGAAAAARAVPHEHRSRRRRLAAVRAVPPRALLIGSSTGGPQALTALDRKASRRDRPRAGPDHAAHAADLHDGAGRAFVARSAAAARMKPSMASRCWPAASMWRRAAAICAWCASRRRHQDRARRRSADQFLQARGRCAVLVGGGGLGRRQLLRSFSPAWAPTARAAPPISSPPAAA